MPSALDFPASPTVGQTYPNPPVTGQPTYQWDGAQWLSKFALGKEYVPLDGTMPMTGLLTLSGAPTAPLHAATKTYVDTVTLSYNGMQVNGSFDVSQERGFSSPVTGNYFCDGWAFYAVGTMSANCGVYPTNAFPGMPNCAVVIVATAQASMGAADYCILQTIIEGYRVARLGWGVSAGQPITIGFWTMHSKTGTYSVVVSSSSNDRSYGTTYTQNVANTPEYKTVTIPPPSDGTWLATNGKGLTVVFAVACGATYTLPAANTWTTRVSTSSFAVPGQVNGVDSTLNNFRLTGVVVLPGIEAPSAANSPLIMRPYDQELITCKRYWERVTCYTVGYSGGASNTVAYFSPFSVEKRAVPVVTLATTGGVSNFTSVSYAPNVRGIVHAGTTPSVGAFAIDYLLNGDARL